VCRAVGHDQRHRAPDQVAERLQERPVPAFGPRPFVLTGGLDRPHPREPEVAPSAVVGEEDVVRAQGAHRAHLGAGHRAQAHRPAGAGQSLEDRRQGRLLGAQLAPVGPGRTGVGRLGQAGLAGQRLGVERIGHHGPT